MISIDIKNRLFTLFAKLVNIFDFNSKGLNIENTGSGETCIYYIKYNKDPFTSKSQKMMYTKIWEEI